MGVFLDIQHTRAIVLKTMDIKENDKVVWIYSEDLGKVSFIAKGSKKKNSKFMSITQNFVFANFTIFKGKSAYLLNEGEIIDSFQDVLKDLETLTYSSYVCELLDLTQNEKEKNPMLFKEAIKMLYFLKNGVGNFEMLIRAFEVKLIRLSGYNLEMNNCTRCGIDIKVSEYFDLSNLGCICESCNKNNSFKITKGTNSTLTYILNNDIEKIFRLNINPIIKKELNLLLSHIINEIAVRPPKSLEMIKILKGE